MTAQITRRTAIAAGFALFATNAALAGKPAIYKSEGLGASGYDVVAYFTEGKPVDGSNSLTARHEGATWRFSSAENRDLFVENPAKYAPQFGGYCAYAVSQGYTASTVPEAWKIVDDKLYLNYSKGVQKRWEGNQSGFITDAHANWPTVLN